MRNNVYWVNSAAIVRGQEIFPIRYINPAATGPDPFALPSVSLIVPVHLEPGGRPFRCDSIESIDYPLIRLTVRLVADGVPPSELRAVEHRVSRLRGDGMEISLVCHPRYRGQIAVLDEAVASDTSDVIVLAELATPFPPDALRKVARVHADSAAAPGAPSSP